jgi:hypothetical protein
MKTFGGYLLFFGIGSILLHFIGMQFKLLSWIDAWGDTTGWAIRIGIAVVGALLWFLGSRKDEAAVAG